MRSFTNLTLAQIQADPVPVIEHWLARYPLLWWGGIADGYQISTWPKGRLEENRAETKAARGIPQVIRAAQFLDQAPRIQSFNTKQGTYGWKHVAERFHQMRAPRDDYYVGEGAFLIACWSMGVRVSRPGQAGVWINLSQKAHITTTMLDAAVRAAA